MVIKIVVPIIVILVAFYLSFLAFNHIDAWAGVGACAVTIIGICVYAERLIKKQIKKNQ